MYQCCEHCLEIECAVDDAHTDPCEFAVFHCGGDQLTEAAREASLEAMTKARALL